MRVEPRSPWRGSRRLERVSPSPALQGTVPVLTSPISSLYTNSDKLPSSWGWQEGCSAHPEIWPREVGQTIETGMQKRQLFLTPTHCISQFSKHRMWSCCPQGSAAPEAGVTSRWLWEVTGSCPCTPEPLRRSPSWAGGQQTPEWKTIGQGDSSSPADEKGKRLWTLRKEGVCGH